MGSFRDYTNTHALRAEREVIAFAEAFDDPLIVVSSQGVINYCSESFLNQLGYSAAEILGTPFDQLITHLDFENCKVQGEVDTGKYTLRIDGAVSHKNRGALAAELTFFMFHTNNNSQASTAVIICRFASRSNIMKSNDFSADCNDSSNARLSAMTRCHSIIGTSGAIGCIREMIALVGKTDSSVLITGESGTGKELVADEIHAASRRSDRPLVKVNCAALPETLLESELFGFTKGAFTGAAKDSFGLLKAADGATLFLDEISEMSPSGQSKLLQVLETQEFHRIGETTPIKIDARIISATNQDLNGRIQKQLFREDLYYRLNVIEIKVPPLRDRTEDIPALVEHFLKMLNRKLNKSIHAVSDDVLKFFAAQSWPGNVRELAHALEHACVLCQNKIIHLHHLPPELQKNSIASNRLNMQHGMPSADMIRKTLIKTGGNKALAARMLGINRKTLYRYIEKHHLSGSV